MVDEYKLHQLEKALYQEGCRFDKADPTKLVCESNLATSNGRIPAARYEMRVLQDGQVALEAMSGSGANMEQAEQYEARIRRIVNVHGLTQVGRF